MLIREYNNTIAEFKDYYGRDLNIIRLYKRKIKILEIKCNFRNKFSKKFFKYFTN